MQKLLIILGTLGLLSCSRSSETSGTPFIAGKWIVSKTVITNNMSNGTVGTITITGHPGEYADFRADGKLYRCFWTGVGENFTYDTLNYQLINNDKVDRWSLTFRDTLHIETLTNAKLILYGKTIYQQPAFINTTEQWETYTK
jgi:hypothetical protein